MCGIVGYTGSRIARDVLIDGLRRLEYRGYDSAGVAILNENGIKIKKCMGNVDELEKNLVTMRGNIGIAHTRWATHGAPSKKNAHPFIDCSGRLAIVHNGIIENHTELKRKLKGHKFTSETDSEVIAHLIESNLKGDFTRAFKKSLSLIKGSYAIAVICEDENFIMGARVFSPLIIGIGDGENFIASDVPAVLRYTDRVIYLNDGESVKLWNDKIEIYKSSGAKVNRQWQRIDWSVEQAEKSGFAHYTLKEIYEQPRVILETLIALDTEPQHIHTKSRFLRFTGCGSSYYAGMVGKYIIEELTGLNVYVELSSEAQHHPDIPLIAISQSGETADTLKTMREAKKKGIETISITNVMLSSIVRESEKVIYTRAGPEIGVGSTKSFTTQLVVLYHIALRMGLENGWISAPVGERLRRDINRLSTYVNNVLNMNEHISTIAKKYSKHDDIYLIGKGIHYPVALEGALKLKEWAYVHAEGYASGEMKHGPLALITDDTPVIAIVPDDKYYNKTMNNIMEIVARNGKVIAICTEGNREIRDYADDIIEIYVSQDVLYPVPEAVVLQLLSYHIACERGCSIDKPRNLAKSVTVD